MITVKSGLADKNQVALFEQNPKHPGGEVFITGDKEFQVAETAAVVVALKDGKLVRVEQVVVNVEPDPVIEPEPKRRRRE